MPENPAFESENSLPAETNHLSRRSLLALTAIAGAALTLPSLPARADSAFPYNDINALRFLEEIARVEADFFTRAANSTTADGITEHEMNVFNLIAQQDGQLVRWFRSAKQHFNISTNATFYSPTQSSSWPIPTYHFDGRSFSTRDGLYSAAVSIKETALGAFHGVVGEADSPKMIQAFAALAGVQGRHATILREISGQSPLVAFEAAISRTDAARKFEPYGFNWEVFN